MSRTAEVGGRQLSRSHWGVFEPVLADGRVVDIRPFAQDADPSPLLHSILDALNHRSRVMRPAVREGWLKGGPGAAHTDRGRDRYVEVRWDDALDLVAAELRRVISEHGNESIFAGFVWMGERWPIPSCAIATETLSHEDRRLHLFA